MNPIGLVLVGFAILMGILLVKKPTESVPPVVPPTTPPKSDKISPPSPPPTSPPKLRTPVITVTPGQMPEFKCAAGSHFLLKFEAPVTYLKIESMNKAVIDPDRIDITAQNLPISVSVDRAGICKLFLNWQIATDDTERASEFIVMAS